MTSAPVLVECPEVGCRRAWLVRKDDDLDLVVQHLQRSHGLTEMTALLRVAGGGSGG